MQEWNKVQNLMDTLVTVAERNSNRGMVRENRKSNTNREQGPKAYGHYSNSSREIAVPDR